MELEKRENIRDKKEDRETSEERIDIEDKGREKEERRIGEPRKTKKMRGERKR